MNFQEEMAVKDFQNPTADNFGAIYDAYIGRIYRFIYYKTQHRETAEDLTSRTFMKALDNLESFNREKGSFSNWIYSIARNTVTDYYRVKKNESNINDFWDLSFDENIDRDIDAKQKLKKVEKYLKKLKSQERDIVLLRVWEGLSYKEIAEITGKSEASCKMMFSRTMKDLRADMGLALLLYLLFLKL